MTEDFTEREAHLILELLRASEDRIFPSLRIISAPIQEKSPVLYFFYDGPILEDDLESLNLIDTYFRANCFETFADSGWEYIRADYPEPIPYFPGMCFYARKENPPLLRPQRGVIIESWMDRHTKICIALQRALLNHVFPQIRKVSAAYNDTSATIHAFVDGPISEDDTKSLELTKNYFELQFPAEEMVHCNLSISQVDAPNDMPVFDAIVYLRKESLSYPNHCDDN